MRKWKVLSGKLKKDKSALPDTKAFDLQIAVLNYSPVAYMYTAEFADFLQNAVRDFSKSIAAAKSDDLNVGMYDCLIDGQVCKMRKSAQAQYNRHCETLTHHERVLSGEVSRITDYLKLLRQDLEELWRKRRAILEWVGPGEAPAGIPITVPAEAPDEETAEAQPAAETEPEKKEEDENDA